MAESHLLNIIEGVNQTSIMMSGVKKNTNVVSQDLEEVGGESAKLLQSIKDMQEFLLQNRDELIETLPAKIMP